MPRWTISRSALSELLLSASPRLDRLILEALESDLGEWEGEPPSAFSRSQLQKWIEEGRLWVDGAIYRKTGRLPEFSSLAIEVPDPEPLELVPEDRKLDILYEDSDLVVVNKPPGLTVHPSETQRTGTLVHALLYHVKDLSGIGGKLRPGIVHRIDKDTSGALVITKTDRAHIALTETFSRHEIERCYWALCYGAPDWPGNRIRLETLIGRHLTDRTRMTTEVRNGRRSVSHFQCLEKFGHSGQKPFASWIEARLETGRTHQVRVHLTHLHHSLLGDPLYGHPTAQQPKWKALPHEVRTCVEKLPGQALHARVLAFKHPISGEALRFEAQPPPEFAALLKTLQNYR